MTALDMSYASGDTAPDVKAIINEVKKESDSVPEKFLHTSRNGKFYFLKFSETLFMLRIYLSIYMSNICT